MKDTPKPRGWFGLLADSVRARLESGSLRLEEVRRDRLTTQLQNRFMEQSVRLVQPDDDDFTIVIGEDDDYRNRTPEQLNDERDAAQRAVDRFPHAKGYLNQLTRYVIGRGPTFTPVFGNVDPEEGPDDATKKKINEANEWWKTFCRLNDWNRKEKEIPVRRWRDGEVFVRKFVNDGESDIEPEVSDEVERRLRELASDFDPEEAIGDVDDIPNGMTLIRFIAPEHVVDPKNVVTHGVVTDKDDVETVIGFIVCPDTTKPDTAEFVPVKDVIHSKIGVDSDCKRGRSRLLSLLKNMKRFDDWLNYRLALNLARTAVVLHKKVDGNPTQVAGITSAQQTTREQNPRNTKKHKFLKPGTTVTTNKNVDYQFLSPNLQAQDAQHDGRSILLTMAAETGMPEYMFTGDSSNANYASHLVSESPALRGFHSEQDDIQDVYEDIYLGVIRAGVERGSLKEITEEDLASMGVDIVFPPIQSRDRLEDTKRNEVLHLNDVLSAETWANEEGIDWTVERGRIEKERDERSQRMGPLNRLPRPDDDDGDGDGDGGSGSTE